MQMYRPYWNQRENLFDAVEVGDPHAAALYKRGIYNARP